MNKIHAQFSDKKYEISKIESIERISKSRHVFTYDYNDVQ